MSEPELAPGKLLAPGKEQESRTWCEQTWDREDLFTPATNGKWAEELPRISIAIRLLNSGRMHEMNTSSWPVWMGLEFRLCSFPGQCQCPHWQSAHGNVWPVLKSGMWTLLTEIQHQWFLPDLAFSTETEAALYKAKIEIISVQV